MINLQNALKVASKFVSNDKIKQALELSKTINSPQSAIKALSKFGDPNKIINDGLSRLNSPTAKKMASLFGADEQQLNELKNQIIGFKGQTSQTPKPQNASDRMQELMNGLK